ncbi:MAG: transglutaminase domain-containing protein [Hyphomicrobiaceae bacterium]
MKFEVSHRTTYQYRAPVAQSYHVVHLKPRVLTQQALFHHSLLIEPAPISSTEIMDYFGNATSLLRIEDEHTEFVVHARSTIEVKAAPVPDLAQSRPWTEIAGQAGQSEGRIDIAVRQFVCRSRHVPVSPDIVRFAQGSFPPGRPVLEGAMHLTRRIFETFKFDPRATDISTPIARVLEIKRGVCQDFAHLEIAALRSLGIPARYVSGYLMTRPPPGQTKLRGADASHAWLSVWAPEQGWVDLDPTNGIIPKGEHITVAYGRDYEDISPISGVLLGGGDQTMAVAVDVDPIG